MLLVHLVLSMAGRKPQYDVKPLLSQFLQAYNQLLYAKTELNRKRITNMPMLCPIDAFIQSKQVDKAVLFHDLLKRPKLKYETSFMFI